MPEVRVSDVPRVQHAGLFDRWKVRTSCLGVLLLFGLTATSVKAHDPEQTRSISVKEPFGLVPPPEEEPAGAQPPPTQGLTRTIQEHVPGTGVQVGRSSWAELRISIFSYARYLNQRALDKTYTNAFGNELTIDRRNDVQLQKVMLYFKGFLGTERLRYVLYVWTSNTSQGLGAQVVVAGYFSYKIADFLELGAGIFGLPATRSVRGQWPMWLRQDARPMADEYFRGSYTTGAWAVGTLLKRHDHGLHYRSMLGNNLSQLGINAGQLDGRLDTSSTALWWTYNDVPFSQFGDFEDHDCVALTAGGAFTRSTETRQSQPGKNSPENTQIRLSDGSAIFDDGTLASGALLNSARYRMLAVDSGVKIRGFSLDGEYYFRWVDQFKATGPVPKDELFDHGFTLRSSAMLVKRLLQVYGFGSVIFGQYGRPYDIGGGLNLFPFKTRVMRLNLEAIYAYHAAVGYQSYPIPVGATGPTFMANLEMLF